MFGKKQKEETISTPTNPELLRVEKQFRRETMVLEAQPLIRRIVLFLWAAIDIVLLTIFIIFIGYYIISGSFLDKERVARIGENIDAMHTISEARAARGAVTGSVITFVLGDDNYDLYATIENPNEDWYAEFDYRFTSVAGDSATFRGSVMPLETRPLVALHQSFTSRPQDAELVIEDFSWVRVNAGEVSDVPGFMEAHNRFDITNADYHFDVELDGEQIPRSSFTITNNSPFGYWTPEFIVVLRRAGAIAGINAVTIPGLEAGETRDVNLNWFGGAPSSGEMQIIPNINYFDESAYMAPGGMPGSDLRDTVNDRPR